MTREDRRARLDRALLVLGAITINAGLSSRWYTGTSNGEELTDLRSGFDWLGTFDVVLVLLGFLGVALATLDRHPGGLLAARATTALAGLSFLLLLRRMLSSPEGMRDGQLVETAPAAGPLLTAVGVLAVLVGAGSLALSAARRAPAALSRSV